MLKELYKIQYGEFSLSSGLSSHIYIDSKPVTFSHEGLNLIAEELIALIQKTLPEDHYAVGGLELGAVPIVSALVMKGYSGFVVRKENKDHGTKKRIEGNLQSSDKVILVEDVTTTGRSLLVAKEAIPNEIVAAFTVIDRQQGAKELLETYGIPLHSLLNLENFNVHN